MDFQEVAREHSQAIASVFAQQEKIEALISQAIKTLEAGGKVLWCGNGGSAADAQHMAAELMVRYVKNRQPLASIALTTDTSILTAHANDFEYETVFARQIEGLAKEGDLLISMSTSGASKNILLAQEQAKKQGVFCVAYTGRGVNPLAEGADLSFEIDADKTARIQEAHTLISHLLCEGLDNYF